MTVRVFETTYSPFLLQMTVTMLAPGNENTGKNLVAQLLQFFSTVCLWEFLLPTCQLGT